MIRPMEIGAVFPQTESGDDPVALRDYVGAVEDAGFEFLAAYDHVLGANPERPGGWTGPYTHRHLFHEVFTLFAWVSAMTTRIGLATEILVLPQRQTALVAKQAAEVAVLSGGRLRLGVGIGWNAVEYEALGMSFTDRGARVEEQVELLRRLWADDLVTVDTRWHDIPDAGIRPRPSGGSIPVWMGGNADAARRRIARIADGWMLNPRPAEETRAAVEQMRGLVRDAGRDVDAFGIAGRVNWRGDMEATLQELRMWRDLRASHVSINTMGARLGELDGHVDALRRVLDAWRATGG
jgi:probable F420-dependent oxidoreductase